MTEEVEKQTQNKIKEDKKTSWIVKSIAIFFFIIINVILIIIKFATDKFPFPGWLIFGIEALIFIISFILFFLFEIKNKIKDINKNKELPKAISIEEAEDLVKKELNSLLILDEISEVIDVGTEELGKDMKSTIYSFRFKGTKIPKKEYYIGINLHFPKNKKRIIVNPTASQIAKAKQLLAASPPDAPDMEITETENVLTGVKTKTTKTSNRRPEDKDKNKKVGEIV